MREPKGPYIPIDERYVLEDIREYLRLLFLEIYSLKESVSGDVQDGITDVASSVEDVESKCRELEDELNAKSTELEDLEGRVNDMEAWCEDLEDRLTKLEVGAEED